MIRTFLAATLVFSSILPATVTNAATTGAATSTVNTQNCVQVFVDGAQPQFDAQPRIVNSRTMVPIRAIVEALNVDDVKWDEHTQQVTIIKGKETVIFTIGSNQAYVQGKYKPLDASAMILEDRTFVPLRVLSEAFSLTVDWAAKTQRSYVSTPTGTSLNKNFLGLLSEGMISSQPFGIGTSASDIIAAYGQPIVPRDQQPYRQLTYSKVTYYVDATDHVSSIVFEGEENVGGYTLSDVIAALGEPVGKTDEWDYEGWNAYYTSGNYTAYFAAKTFDSKVWRFHVKKKD